MRTPSSLFMIRFACTQCFMFHLVVQNQEKKTKSDGGPSLSGGATRRWFVVEPVGGLGDNNCNDFALYYYKTKTSKEPIGWYFLSEFEEIDEDTFSRQIILRHPSRTFRLRAEDVEEHTTWIRGLSSLCTEAKVRTSALYSTAVRLFC